MKPLIQHETLYGTKAVVPPMVALRSIETEYDVTFITECCHAPLRIHGVARAHEDTIKRGLRCPDCTNSYSVELQFHHENPLP